MSQNRSSLDWVQPNLVDAQYIQTNGMGELIGYIGAECPCKDTIMLCPVYMACGVPFTITNFPGWPVDTPLVYHTCRS